MTTQKFSMCNSYYEKNGILPPLKPYLDSPLLTIPLPRIPIYNSIPRLVSDFILPFTIRTPPSNASLADLQSIPSPPWLIKNGPTQNKGDLKE